MVSFFPITELPFARQAFITIGSISGVNPTATDNENKNADNQLPWTSPHEINTKGTKIAINLINTPAIEFAPFSNPFLRIFISLLISPYTVSLPTASTIPSPLPPITKEPEKTILL